jgi:hypothetical protein
MVTLKDGIKRMVNNYQDYPEILGYSGVKEVTAEVAENFR